MHKDFIWIPYCEPAWEQLRGQPLSKKAHSQRLRCIDSIYINMDPKLILYRFKINPIWILYKFK